MTRSVATEVRRFPLASLQLAQPQSADRAAPAGTVRP